MNPRRFSLVAGLILLCWGFIPFVPAALHAPFANDPAMTLSDHYGRFINIFPTNIALMILDIVLGVAGLAAYSARFRELPASLSYSRAVAGIGIALAILGAIPATSTLGGYMPLFSHNIWLNAVVGVVGAYYGTRLPYELQNPKSVGTRMEQLKSGPGAPA